MANDSVFAPRYTASWAVIVGIDEYVRASPLSHACNDANAVAVHLVERIGFPKENVRRLTNGGATRQAIASAFLSLAKQVLPDDRVLFFFAGHGLTQKSRRGEVGFLVPADGDPDDLSTLIRWDELTRNAELLPAKHVLFVMDACYGGLALARAAPVGSQRFLKDMLARYARQVLTAGKADEIVDDAGGPRAGHSIFTGHLLDALEGAARTNDGIITANAVMAYVYDHVSKDQYSRQSPHYGFLDGDGDFVFEAPQLDGLLKDAERNEDVLVEALLPPRDVPAIEDRQRFTSDVKEFLSEPRYRIRLDDLVVAELRAHHQAVAEANFPLSTETHSAEDVAERLRRYERATDRLASIAALMARWGGSEHRASLSGLASRLAEENDAAGGQIVWIGLRWHSCDYLMYAAGVAAMSAEAYENLASLLLARVSSSRSGQQETTVVEATVDGTLEAIRSNAYKLLPGHERNFTPRSEYLLKVVQPVVEDLLLLGRAYERAFDRFEVLAALVYADLRLQKEKDAWGPLGRFAWKAKQGYGGNPLTDFLAEADRLQENWGVLRAGFFGGSFSRFKKSADAFVELAMRYPVY